MNAPAAAVGATAQQAAATITGWGFPITADALAQMAHQMGETTILARAGGAPTLAAGMAKIFSNVLGGPALMAFWYHFAILFEAMFILTTLDAGTRVARFMIQDFAGMLVPSFRRGGNWVANITATALAVGGWGYFLYQGVTDPLGGINTLWPLFGIANQMLAAIALTFCTVVLFKMQRQRFAWVAAVPTAWLAICTLTAGAEKVLSPVPAIGFLAHAARYRAAVDSGALLAPAKSTAAMHQIIANDTVDVTLTALFMAVVITMLATGAHAAWRAALAGSVTTREVPDDMHLLRQNV
jgi:carbon starvation protein